MVTAGRDMREASAFSQETEGRILTLELDISSPSVLPKSSKVQGYRGLRGAERREDERVRRLCRRDRPRWGRSRRPGRKRSVATSTTLCWTTVRDVDLEVTEPNLRYGLTHSWLRDAAAREE